MLNNTGARDKTYSLLFDELKANLSLAGNFARRVFHGRGQAFEQFHELNIEWYPPYLLIQNFGSSIDSDMADQFKKLMAEFNAIEAIIEQSRVWPDFKATCLCSRHEPQLPISALCQLDDVISCEVSLGKNRNTGVFLDMRAGWDWVRNNARGKRVLNLFSYTGVFSLFALHGGATYVDNVDMAANVLKIAQRNHKKNELHDGQTAFFKRDILKSARWLENRTPYDLIITDPPPYQKKAFRGWNDYSKLLLTCKEALNPGGQILVCLNNPQVSIDELIESLRALFPEATNYEIVERAQEIKESDNSKGLKVIAVTI